MRKIISILLCLPLLTGCSENDQASSPVWDGEPVVVDHVYTMTPLKLPEGCAAYYSAETARWGGGFTVLCEDCSTLHFYDDTGTLTASRPITAEGWLGNLTACDDGLLYTDKADGMYRLMRYDGESAVVCEDVEDLFSDITGRFSLKGVAADGDGNIYLAAEQAVCVIDAEGTVQFELDITGNYESIGSADGRVYIKSLESDSRQRVYRWIDADGKDWGDTLPMPDTLNVIGVRTYSGGGYAIYADDGLSLWGVNLDGTVTELLDWVNSDILWEDILTLTVIDADRVVIGQDDGIYLLTRLPDDELPERQLVTLAAWSDGLGIERLRRQIVKFNRTNDTWRVVLDDYARYDGASSFGQGRKQLQNDLIAGYVPDILLLSNLSEREEYLTSGMFADLYTLMDDDPDFSEDDLVDCVKEPFERYGALYELVTEFALTSYAGKAENLPEEWTADSFIKWESALPENVYAGEYLMEPERMLSYLLRGSITDYVDGTWGTCSFDRPSFRSLLQYTKNCGRAPFESTLTAEEEDARSDDLYKFYREDRIMLKSEHILEFSDVYSLSADFGGEVRFVGYPGSGGALVDVVTSLAVLERSEVKEGAWAFLKSILTDVSFEPNGINTFKAGKAQNQAMFEYEKSVYYIVREDGRLVRSVIRLDAEYVQPTDKDIDFMWALLDSADALPLWYDTIAGIITEEAAMYFAGDKSLDDTIKIIQDRCSTYFAEQS